MPPTERSTLTARIAEWDHQKGFGFLQVGKQRVFLHRREFAERHKKPAVGDVIRFSMGQDPQGRSCATRAVHVNDGGKITILTVGFTIGLLVLPLLALYRAGLSLPWVALYILVVNSITYTRYAADKRLARAKEWRIPEAQLQALDILGGWPGGFLAQRHLRHKSSKVSYQIVFWMTVFLYQFAAYDSLQDWRFCQTVKHQIEELPRATPADGFSSEKRRILPLGKPATPQSATPSTPADRLRKAQPEFPRQHLNTGSRADSVTFLNS